MDQLIIISIPDGHFLAVAIFIRFERAARRGLIFPARSYTPIISLRLSIGRRLSLAHTSLINICLVSRRYTRAGRGRAREKLTFPPRGGWLWPTFFTNFREPRASRATFHHRHGKRARLPSTTSPHRRRAGRYAAALRGTLRGATD